MTKTTKIAVLMSSCVVALIGIKASDFLSMYPESAWWQGILAGIAYVIVLFVAAAVLIGLATLWIDGWPQKTRKKSKV